MLAPWANHVKMRAAVNVLNKSSTFLVLRCVVVFRRLLAQSFGNFIFDSKPGRTGFSKAKNARGKNYAGRAVCYLPRFV